MPFRDSKMREQGKSEAGPEVTGVGCCLVTMTRSSDFILCPWEAVQGSQDTATSQALCKAHPQDKYDLVHISLMISCCIEMEGRERVIERSNK